jgi:KDO2-lipid IV(A) lauroyltransferase
VRKLKFWILLAAMRVLALLPWSLLRCFGSALGRLLWLLRARARHVTEINLSRCLPELSAPERERLARASLVDFGQTALEIAKVWFTAPRAMAHTIVEIEGEELLQDALASGRGAMVLGPHHGNWEMLGLFLGRNYGLTTMYLPPRDPALDLLVRTTRTRGGANVAPANNSGIRIVLKALKRGGVVGVLPDQVPKQAGAEFAPFFGTPALTMTLPSNLLQKTGARALFGYALRVAGGFRIVFRAADPEIYAADLDQSLAALNRGVEACARQCPQQYQWEYKRFKVQPPGYPRVY